MPGDLCPLVRRVCLRPAESAPGGGCAVFPGRGPRGGKSSPLAAAAQQRIWLVFLSPLLGAAPCTAASPRHGNVSATVGGAKGPAEFLLTAWPQTGWAAREDGPWNGEQGL